MKSNVDVDLEELSDTELGVACGGLVIPPGPQYRLESPSMRPQLPLSMQESNGPDYGASSGGGHMMMSPPSSYDPGSNTSNYQGYQGGDGYMTPESHDGRFAPMMDPSEGGRGSSQSGTQESPTTGPDFDMMWI